MCENIGKELISEKYGDEFFQKKLIPSRLWRFEEQPFKGLPCPSCQQPVGHIGLTGRGNKLPNLTSTEKINFQCPDRNKRDEILASISISSSIVVSISIS